MTQPPSRYSLRSTARARADASSSPANQPAPAPTVQGVPRPQPEGMQTPDADFSATPGEPRLRAAPQRETEAPEDAPASSGKSKRKRKREQAGTPEEARNVRPKLKNADTEVLAPTTVEDAEPDKPSENVFVAAAEWLTRCKTLAAFDQEKSRFLGLHRKIESPATANQYMLGCKVLVCYASEELKASEESCQNIFVDGLQRIFATICAAGTGGLATALRKQVQACAFDSDTPPEITAWCIKAWKTKERDNDQSDAMECFRKLGLRTILRKAKAPERTSETPSWSALMDKLKTCASTPVAETASVDTALQAQARIQFQVGNHTFSGATMWGQILCKLSQESLTSQEALRLLEIENLNGDCSATYARVLVLVMIYFTDIKPASPRDVIEILWTATRILSNDHTRAYKQGRDLTKFKKGIELELDGHQVPIRFSEILDEYMELVDLKDQFWSAVVTCLKNVRLLHRDESNHAGRLSYQELLAQCRVTNAALDEVAAATAVTTTTTTSAVTTTTTTTSAVTTTTTTTTATPVAATSGGTKRVALASGGIGQFSFESETTIAESNDLDWLPDEFK